MVLPSCRNMKKKSKKQSNTMPSLVAPSPSEVAELRKKAALYENYISNYKDVQKQRNLMAIAAEELRANTENILCEIFELSDDMERAIEFSVVGRNFDAVLSGLRPIADKFDNLLAHQGITVIVASAGMLFDPRFHHSLDAVQPSHIGKRKILKVRRRGYRSKEKILRKSLVELEYID